MKIKSLKLLYFRNYLSTNIEVHPSLNVLVGNNANGKTNIIESIFCLALGKSYRTKSDSECIMFGETATAMSCIVNKNNRELDIMLGINNKGKSAKIAGIKKTKLTDFVGELNVVLFSPEDLQIVKGSPALRREFMNREFYQFSRIYHKYYLMYQHLLKQRNSYLKDMRKNPKDEMSLAYLETLTSQLAKVALYITKERVSFVQDISKLTYKNMLNISNGQETLKIKYKSSVLDALNISEINDESFTEENLTKVMMKKSFDDIMRGSTKIGPQHDDLEFYINDLDAKMYASQGQQRSIVLSLKLAEINYLKEKTGTYPVLLLDDVLSELDKNRQLKLLDAINENVQTFITTPSISDIKEDLLKKAKVFKIEDGNISEIV
ncbi:MAG: DNA replication/repair protein RecF [Gemella haemolysans]|jgi:DNA replication and repair protein recF|uniref:DNA replication and repair protein RecF n=1 Tax=Gemella haemolysans TaxID=1379 RepID=A0A133ZSE0_9BACL|nr:DNA replication/repair protein RecF [Gemella haemolysans]KXB58341.1 putative DNA replication and repair protein RecF [Gemella haemolysans]MBS5319554.1 DNA replication/repair protein RecF [Gemella haemolysans]TKW64517.1 MAG: DNA replication/repair protein RecF [Gemella sp.]